MRAALDPSSQRPAEPPRAFDGTPLAAALRGVGGIHALQERRVAGARSTIEHLIVSRAGIFVVDAKLYSGLVQVRGRASLLRSERRLYAGPRDCSHLVENMAWQVRSVESALRAGGVNVLPPVTPVICFVDGQWPMLFPPSSFRGVRLVSLRSLRRLLAAVGPLDHATVDRLARILAIAFPAA
jgi:hypothetical protein